MESPCISCAKPATKRCPTCKNMGVDAKAARFCDQACFKKSWMEHNASHVNTSVFKGTDEGKSGSDEFRTFDDDKCLGKAAPSLDSLEVLGKGDVNGDVVVLVLWGQYHKPGYKFLPFYSQLQAKYGKAVKFVGVSIDPSADYPTKFITDPAKKYSTVFPCNYTQTWDKAGTVKKALIAVMQKQTLSPPHAFVLDKKRNIVWHQDHSELGAVSCTHMDLFESQLDLVLAGKAVTSVGERPVEEESEEEEEEECNVAVDGDDDDPFAFM